MLLVLTKEILPHQFISLMDRCHGQGVTVLGCSALCWFTNPLLNCCNLPSKEKSAVVSTFADFVYLNAKTFLCASLEEINKLWTVHVSCSQKSGRKPYPKTETVKMQFNQHDYESKNKDLSCLVDALKFRIIILHLYSFICRIRIS